MNRWTYYSPLLLGIVVVLALNESIRAGLVTLSSGGQWATVVAIALVTAVQCQILMVGAQGLFAQVLPVPVGKSIRGSGAALAGGLLIVWVALSGVTVLLAIEDVGQSAWVVGVLAVAALAGAAITYIWELPTAIEDFRMTGRR